MCGIAGAISLINKKIYNIHNKLDRIYKSLNHRGPDQKGIYIAKNSNFFFINTRLSIVGVNDKINIPLQSSNNKSVLTFNGEIYNYKNLKIEMERNKLNFYSNTDTEVLLNGLELQGKNFLEQIDGFWSFAFANITDNSFIISRDLMGEKPLYYTIEDNIFYFASELNTILELIQKKPNFEISSIIASFQNRSAPPGKTLLQNIKRLKGGEIIVIKPNEERKVIQHSFLSLKISNWLNYFSKEPSLENIIDTYNEELLKSCSGRIPQEVDFYTTLSGGIDSNLINSTISKNYNNKISAIHAHSQTNSPKKNRELSELESAQYTAKKFKINLDQINLNDINSIDILEDSAKNSFDGVFCEGVASFRQLARYSRLNDKKVLILSDGPDELLTGYDVDMRVAKMTHKYQSDYDEESSEEDFFLMNGFSKQDVLNWKSQNSEPFAVRPNHAGTTNDNLINIFDINYLEIPNKIYGTIPDRYKELLEVLDYSQLTALGYASSSIPDYTNTRIDRGVMKESVESRLPFLSLPLVELMIATPNKYRFFKNNWSKYILRKLVEKNISENVAFRSKYGFAQPMWKNEEIYNKLKIKDTIMQSDIFSALPFSKNIREYIFLPQNNRFIWMMFCLILTFENLKNFKYDEN